MWVFNQDGFFSAVQDENDSGTLLVRARCRLDLERFCSAVEGVVEGDIIETKDSDYPCRVFVPREVFAQYLVDQTMDLDYPNFKNQLKDIGEPSHRLDAMMAIWGVMRRFQDKEADARKLRE